MTLGKKISNLRTAAHISQETLAEKLNVSRQSVSKWEIDQALPQIDKVLLLCEIFSVSCDSLLREDINIFGDIPGKRSAINQPDEGNKYFGTDGFRGEANVTLTSDQAYRVGRFLGWYFTSPLSGFHSLSYKPRILIGKDTRRSSYMLEYSLAAGITASGADAYMLHVTTTPSVSYVTRQDGFDCGIMITASHNPFYDNGIKVLNGYGEKMDDRTVSLIEAYLDGNLEKLGVEGSDLPLAKRDKIGCIVDYVAGRNRYVGYLISLASHSYKELKIGLDCANGASWMIARAVFDALGAKTYVIGASPDGTNVNENCGSTHIDALRKLVSDNHLDVGFAFDGDADRCIAVDENGNVVDGDGILYIIGSRLKSRGMLDGNKVVATVMSNTGLFKALDAARIGYEKTAVGDRFVYECMEKNGYRLGGEQSGHIILRKYATTGDGILTAIMIAEEMRDKKSPLSKLTEAVVLYPQITKSIRVTDKNAVLRDDEVLKKYSEISDQIDGNGRVLLRASGTEPVVRIMIECENISDCTDSISKIYNVIKKRGYLCE
ncbi:MAG: phosphoglucosamine mutase [Firmicutes bacterium]|nr:phosphoglucosamine mutase [Bacillota bacterium]